MVEVEYDGVTMEANALVGDAGIPTIANTARGVLRVRNAWPSMPTCHSDQCIRKHGCRAFWWLRGTVTL